MVHKRLLRAVPSQFSWVDHRLVRERHLERCPSEALALALYLFLVTVADAKGLSYYGDASVRARLGWGVAQIARRIGADARTVRFWLQEPVFRPRKRTPRPSKLDPYKPAICRWLEQYPYSAQQVFQRLRDDGYEGGVGIVRRYVRRVRPSKAPAFLSLHFEPGVRAGGLGSIRLGPRRQHPAAVELLGHGAVLQPHDVRGVHRLAVIERQPRARNPGQ